MSSYPTPGHWPRRRMLTNRIIHPIHSDLGVVPVGTFFLVDYDPRDNSAVIMVEGISYRVDQDELRKAAM